jgi:hypothetical protein
MRCGQMAFYTLGGTAGYGGVGAGFPDYGFELSFQRLDLLLERNDAPEVGHREIRKRFHRGKDAWEFAGVKHWFCLVLLTLWFAKSRHIRANLLRSLPGDWSAAARCVGFMSGFGVNVLAPGPGQTMDANLPTVPFQA